MREGAASEGLVIPEEWDPAEDPDGFMGKERFTGSGSGRLSLEAVVPLGGGRRRGVQRRAMES